MLLKRYFKTRLTVERAGIIFLNLSGVRLKVAEMYTLLIGIWNVRTLYESGKILQLETEILCWIGTHRARGREEDQRRPGRGTKRRKDVEGGEVAGSGQKK
jgi:hypothetical protein